MEFFDKKEEVLDIQLTQYGKHLLSLGKFKPTQYAFFDNDIIYDISYASGSEQQNKTEQRIKEVPRTKVQYVFSGIETEVKKINQRVKHGTIYGDTDLDTPGVQFGEISKGEKVSLGSNQNQPGPEKNYSLMLPLGNSSLSSKYSPAWDIKFLHNSASVFTDFITGSHFKLVRVPQGEVQVTYKTYITQVDEDGLPSPNYLPDVEDPSLVDPGDPRGALIYEALFDKQYADSTTIQIEKDYVFLDVLEENVDFKKENFDIEVFLIDESGNETQLQFAPNFEIMNLEDLDVDTRGNYVEWWFDIFTDNEIDSQVYCKTRQEDRRKNIFADQFSTFDCEDTQQLVYGNIYETELTDEDFEDPC